MAGKRDSGLSDKEAAFLAAAQRELAAKKAATPVATPAAHVAQSRPAPPAVPAAPAPASAKVSAPVATLAATTVPAPLAARTTAGSIPAATATANAAVPVDAPAPDAPTPPARGALPEAAAQRLAALMAQEAEENARRRKRMRLWTTHVPVGLLVLLIGWVLSLLAGLLKRNTF